MTLTPEQAVDSINGVFGSHPGTRALHAKGILLRGSFSPAPEAAELTRAPHMQGEPVPATFRFSNGAGSPHRPDFAPDPRGLAVKMYLPDGSRTDIVAVSSPLFPTRTPEGFIELLEAQSAGAATAWKLPRFLLRHPEALSAVPRIAPTLRPPSSYATIRYYGIHAFKWVGAAGEERYVRYTLRPQASAPMLAPWQARRLGRDYLRQEILERVQSGAVRFTLELQVAEPGDPVNDPSAPWPRSRRRPAAGTFMIEGLETEREQGDDVLVFDPSRLVEGIELSDDPVLRFRPGAYSESVARRTGS